MNQFLHGPLFALMLLLMTSPGAGTGVINPITEKDAVTPGHYDLYVDSTGRAGFGQVSRLPEGAFRQLPDKRKMTEPGVHYWLRFKIKNLSGNALVLETPREYRTAELYVPSAGGYRKSVFDIYRPWGENEYIFNNPSFALPGVIPDGYFYLHLRSDIRVGLGFWLFEGRPGPQQGRPKIHAGVPGLGRAAAGHHLHAGIPGPPPRPGLFLLPAVPGQPAGLHAHPGRSHLAAVEAFYVQFLLYHHSVRRHHRVAAAVRRPIPAPQAAPARLP
jgi:hypothetical protein